MKTFSKTLAGVAAALVAAFTLTAAATAANLVDVGFNPTTGLQGFPGLEVALGTPPATTGSTCASGTLTVLGGSSAGQITTATCTTLVAILTWTIPALPGIAAAGAGSGYSQSQFAPLINGAYCNLTDITTGADNTIANTTAIGVYTAPTATAAGKVVCTFASKTIVAADVLVYSIQLY